MPRAGETIDEWETDLDMSFEETNAVPAVALERAVEVEPIVAVDPTAAPAAVERVLTLETAAVEPLPDWWGDGYDNNVAPGWTKCETEWGGGYCYENSKPRKKYSNWNDAIVAANLLGEECGGITKTTNGYSLRRTRQCSKTTITNASKDSLACWSKDYSHDGKKFTPSRNPIIPLTFPLNSSNRKARHELAIQYDIESQQEFEEWISNGCE
jgi:hypothetical protein